MRGMLRSFLLALGPTAAMLTFGCVANEAAEVVAARRELDRCVELRDPKHPKCQATKVQLEEVQRRYLEGSLDWGS